MNTPSGSKFNSFLRGHSRLELQIAAYITILFIAACALFIYTDLGAKSLSSPKNYATVSRNGTTSTAKQNADPAPTAYTKETFHGHDFQVTLNFDPNAYGRVVYTPNRTTPNGTQVVGSGSNELDIFGKPLGSSKQLVIIATPQNEAPPVVTPQAMESRGIAADFKTIIMGKPYTIYDYSSDTEQLFTTVSSGKSWYEVSLNSDLVGETHGFLISQSTAEEIFKSVTINR